MIAITPRSQARTVAARFAEQYPPKCYRTEPGRRIQVALLNELDGETATPAQIAAIVGNDSWCCPQPCDECARNADVVVQLGSPFDCESPTARVCAKCLRDALSLAEKEGAAALEGGRDAQ